MKSKIFLLRARRKLKVIISKPIKYIYAKRLLHRVIREKNANTVVILLSSQLGDTVYGLAFVGAYKSENPNKYVVAVGMKKYEKILKNYTGVDELIYVNSSKKYKYIDAYIRTPRVMERGYRYGIIPTIPLFYKNIFKEQNADTIFQLRKIYGVADNAPITYHKVALVPVRSIPNFEKEKRRIAILNPYSTALFSANMELFELLCKVLKKMGYIVFTNVINDQKEVLGSQKLVCSLEELYSIAKDIPIIVSVRSGILDYLIPSGINIFVVFENCFERWIELYHLRSWNGSGRVKEIYLPQKEEYPEVADKLRVFLKQL